MSRRAYYCLNCHQWIPSGKFPHVLTCRPEKAA